MLDDQLSFNTAPPFYGLRLLYTAQLRCHRGAGLSILTNTLEPATEPAETDLLTIVSIGIVAYIVGNVIHEGLGHGGACLITGGKPLLISTVNMDCSIDNRFVMAGGSLMNAVAAALFFLLARATPRTSPHLRYFAWLSMTLNLLSPAGYLAFSGIGGFGDWAQFIEGFTPQWAWRVALAIAGAAAYMRFVKWSLLAMRPLIGSDRRERRIQAVRLTMAPYFAGGIVACLAGALNPQGWFLVAMSAAASTFGGSSALLWSPNLLRGSFIQAGEDAFPMPIPRSVPWIAAAVVMVLTFILVLGPGVHLTAGGDRGAECQSAPALVPTPLHGHPGRCRNPEYRNSQEDL